MGCKEIKGFNTGEVSVGNIIYYSTSMCSSKFEVEDTEVIILNEEVFKLSEIQDDTFNFVTKRNDIRKFDKNIDLERKLEISEKAKNKFSNKSSNDICISIDKDKFFKSIHRQINNSRTPR